MLAKIIRKPFASITLVGAILAGCIGGCEGHGTLTVKGKVNTGVVSAGVTFNYQWDNKTRRAKTPNGTPTDLIPILPDDWPATRPKPEIWNTPTGPVIRSPEYPDHEWPVRWDEPAPAPPSTSQPQSGFVGESTPVSYTFGQNSSGAWEASITGLTQAQLAYMVDYSTQISVVGSNVVLTSSDPEILLSGLVIGGVEEFVPAGETSGVTTWTIEFTDGTTIYAANFLVGTYGGRELCLPLVRVDATIPVVGDDDPGDETVPGSGGGNGGGPG